MGRLTLPSADNFRGPAASLYGSVSLNMDPGDGMFHGNSTHYLTCGASAFNTITAAIGLGQIEPDAFLDFGSGSGRVTRWLRAAYPVAKIDACDIRASDLEFCASEFAANTWISGTDIDALKPPSSYDVIWVGSVVTHLSAERSERLVKQLFSWLNPNGIVVLSFHGRFAQIRGLGSAITASAETGTGWSRNISRTAMACRLPGPNGLWHFLDLIALGDGSGGSRGGCAFAAIERARLGQSSRYSRAAKQGYTFASLNWRYPL